MVHDIRMIAALAIVLMLGSYGGVYAETPIHLRLTTGDGSDTLRVGEPGRLVFRIDSCENRSLVRIVCPLTFNFSNTRIMGPLADWVELSYSEQAVDVFDYITWKTGYHAEPGGADTTRIVFQHPRDSLAWDHCGELWWMTIVPVDTGTITIDTVAERVESSLLVETVEGIAPIRWQSTVITVAPACGVQTMGDLDVDGRTTPTDVMCLVQYLYLDSVCVATCLAAADANCDAQITTADVLHLMRYQLGIGPPPCDVCLLVEQGMWRCP
jgi:hypothetical protein